jgi:UDP-N-acetylmuramoyl-L-alanyl-D-glutamate--2,6-diaminopimelate ligase
MIVFDSSLKNEINAFRKRNYNEDQVHAFTAQNLNETIDSIEFVLAPLSIQKKAKNIMAPLVGSFQIENIATSLLAVQSLGFELDPLAEYCKLLSGVPGRLQRVLPSKQITQQNPKIFVDYAHSPDSLEQSILSLRTLANKQEGARPKIVTVFGCGGDRDTSKRPLMGKIASTLSDFVVITSDNPRTESPKKIVAEIVAGIDSARLSDCTIEIDRCKAIELAIEKAGPDDLVLIAGKGHENYQIIQNERIPFSDLEITRSALENRPRTQGK